jgi:hypothetical protein
MVCDPNLVAWNFRDQSYQFCKRVCNKWIIYFSSLKNYSKCWKLRILIDHQPIKREYDGAQQLKDIVVSDRHMENCDELHWLKLAMNGPSTNQMNSYFSIVWNPKIQNKGWTMLVFCPIHQNLKVMRTRWAFNMIQNFTKRHEGWRGDDSLQFCFRDDTC